MEAERVAGEHTGDIDVLLTDIVMPGIRGPELADRLRSMRPMLRVVYMSGYRDTETLADVERGEAVFLAQAIPAARRCSGPSRELQRPPEGPPESGPHR